MSPAHFANQRMVDRLIAQGALWSCELIDAFRATPRHQFLDRVFVFRHNAEGWSAVDMREPSDDDINLIYSDRALITRLGTGALAQVPISSSSQPSLMAEMLEDLRPSRGQRVLEIGTGTGYNAAILAHVVGSGLVQTLDVDDVVLAEAGKHLDGFRDRDVSLHRHDGRDGWPKAAPYDRIIVTAATPDLEPAWLAQMSDGGRLVAPLVLAPGLAFVVCGTVHQGIFEGALTRSAYFMPLRAADELPRDDNEITTKHQALRTRPAPWAGWFDGRHPRIAWSSFIQAFVFYGWLRGWKVLHSGGQASYANYGLGINESVCWFDADDWQANGAAAFDLAEELWQAWMQAGGPWPTEFTLTAPAPKEKIQDGSSCFCKRGPRGFQTWHLNERRNRPGWH